MQCRNRLIRYFGGGVHGTMALFSPDDEAEQSPENFKRLPFAVA